MTNGPTEYSFLAGGGELGALTRSFAWEQTPMGPIAGWPEALRTTVGILLHTDFPMFLWWGDDMIQFYNDGYRPSLGNQGKHPLALGQRAEECWPEIWHIIYPLIRQVKDTGKSFFFEDQLVPIFRNGKIEDVYWTFSYSGVIGSSGAIDGVLVVCTETTKKILTVKELEKSQQRASKSEVNLRNIILQAPVAMCIYKGTEYVVEIANQKMFELWGKPESAFLDKPFFDALPEARGQGFEELLNKTYTTGETITAYGVPVTLPRAGTVKTVYVQFVYEAFRDADGQISGVMAVAMEVTEQVKTAAILEKSEQEVRALVESAPFPIGVYVGREMRIRFLNKAIMEVWGKGHTGLVGKTYYEALPELATQAVYEHLDGVFSTGVPYRARNQRIDLMVDGHMKSSYFNYDFTPLYDAEGNIYGVMNTAADVTDLNVAKLKLEQSEWNFRNMVRQAPVAMCIMIGPHHVVEIANERMIELWGKPEEQVLNKPIFEGLPDARGQGLEALLDQVYRTGQTFHANERPVVLLRKGREDTVYQNFVYEAYRDSDGRILGVLAITIDVTLQVKARLRIEEVVKERTESLRKTNEELSRFAYVASHDLQEPVRKIGVFVEMLEKSLGKTDDRSAGYLKKIDDAAARMLNLIRGILDVSRLSDVGQAAFENVDLNQVVEDMKSEFELLIEEKQCTIITTGLPKIQAIRIQMSQLFSNLISNALKFSDPARKLVITINAMSLSEAEKPPYPALKPGAPYIKITMADNGIGFPQEYAGQIFEMFQRLHTSSDYRGTGIGLATAKKIVENHKGHIYANATPGQGATFTLILPIAQ